MRMALLGVLAGLLPVSTACVAEEGADAGSPPTPEQIFDRIDRDASGWIDPEEFRNAMMRRFARLDADGDGVLRGAEIPQHGLAAQTAGEHNVAREDFQDAIQHTLERVDGNRNGVLSLDEFRAARQETQP